MNATETTKIGSRTYTVERIDDTHYPRLAAEGFDGYAYWLLGVRKARKLAYRSSKTGQYVVIAG
jgi:hypothetical protein